MKPQRYAAMLPLAGSGRDAPCLRRMEDRKPDGFRALPFHGGTLLISAETTCFPCRGGHFVGSLFDEAGSFVSDPTVFHSALSDLVERYWGGYIVLRRDGHHAIVFRDPSGAIPCYYKIEADGVIIASDFALLLHLADRDPVIDWSIVSALLLAVQYRSRETAIHGIRELLPGECLTLGASEASTEMLWSPWQQAATDVRVADVEVACNRVRSAVQLSVSGWSSVISHPLVSVSGGLDSSIVAACLSSCGAAYDSFTLATDAAIGDERRFARALAEHLHAPLHEAMFDIASIDLTRTAGAHLPRPGARAFLQVTDAVSLCLSDAIGADGFFHGGGGDNVFCTIRSVAPVLDRILTHGSLDAIWSTTRDVATLTGADIWSIARAVVVRLWTRRRAYRWPVDDRLLTVGAIRKAKLSFDHPWLQPVPGALPGTAAHIANLVAIQNYLEGSRRELAAISVAPLMAQPVMEACLGIPSWLWVTGGVDRAIARRAFSTDLPDVIAYRRQKGTPGSIAAELFETRRPQIREWLLDGMMAEAGIIDRPGVEKALTERNATGTMAYARIMTFCDFEAWCRSVRDRQVGRMGADDGT